MNKLLLIDGNSLINRAFYALPLLSNKKGVYTGAVFGFANMLFKAIDKVQPTNIAVAFDVSRKTFRTELYPQYKGTRKETPEELKPQFALVKTMLDCMKIARIEKLGIEADDILGTVAKKYDGKTYILSGDRDLLQLVDPNITMLFTKKGITEIDEYTHENIKEKFGVTAEQVIDLKALMGDKSDNIPGLYKVGNVTARMLIEQFDNIENIYNNISQVKGALREKIENNKDVVYLSRALATIKTDCDLDFDINECKLVVPFGQKLKDFFEEMGFDSLLKKSNIFQNVVKDVVSQVKNLKTLQDIDELLEKAYNAKCIAFCLNGQASFACDDTDYVLPITFDFFTPLTLENCLEKLKPLLEDDNIKKITYDVKSQLDILYKNNILLSRINLYDYSLMRYLVWAGTKIENEPISASYILQNAEQYIQKLGVLNLDNLYHNIELPLTFVLYDMEQTGFKIQTETLEELKITLEQKIESITNQIYELAGQQFNINSPKQVAEILYDKLGLISNMNKKRTTNIDVLNDLADKHPIVPLIIQYRKTHKIYSSYIIPYINITTKNGDIIKTVFNQTLTATGRLSSSEPNLQNIPVRDDDGKILRKIFISRFENGVIMSADYNQIELRLLAHFSEDKNLIDCFNSGIDVHSKTASEIFDTKLENVTPQMRRMAKAVNFGIVYGISDFGLANTVGMPNYLAKEYKQKYFKAYPDVQIFQNKSVLDAVQNGFVKTLYGRIRHIPELQSSNYLLRQFGERIAMNMPLQGTASDIIKIAMINVYNKLKHNNLKSKLILQIHDELILDVVPEEIEVCKDILLNCMQNVTKLKVGLPVEVNFAKNWYECK